MVVAGRRHSRRLASTIGNREIPQKRLARSLPRPIGGDACCRVAGVGATREQARLAFGHETHGHCGARRALPRRVLAHDRYARERAVPACDSGRRGARRLHDVAAARICPLRGWPFYPNAAFPVLVVRPFWYTQLMLPLVGIGSTAGVLVDRSSVTRSPAAAWRLRSFSSSSARCSSPDISGPASSSCVRSMRPSGLARSSMGSRSRRCPIPCWAAHVASLSAAYRAHGARPSPRRHCRHGRSRGRSRRGRHGLRGDTLASSKRRSACS